MSDTISQIAALIKASGQSPSAVLSTLNRLYPGAVQPAGVVAGANVNRAMEPPGQEFQEKNYSGWHPVISQRLANAPNADPNMPIKTPPETSDPMEIWTGKNDNLNPFTGPGQRTTVPSGPTNVAEQREMPQLGPMKGQAFLNPKVAPPVAPGAPRPLGPGEYVQNSDGSWSNEITDTIGQGERPDLNGGRPTIVPTLWVINGVPTRVDTDTAAALAAKSGLQFQSFDTNQAAEAFSQQREKAWQGIKPQDAGSVPALWSAPAAKAAPAAPATPAQGAVQGMDPASTPAASATRIAGDVVPIKPLQPAPKISPNGTALTPDEFSERLKALDWSYKGGAAKPTLPGGNAT
jgi:hypothetical protein